MLEFGICNFHDLTNRAQLKKIALFAHRLVVWPPFMTGDGDSVTSMIPSVDFLPRTAPRSEEGLEQEFEWLAARGFIYGVKCDLSGGGGLQTGWGDSNCLHLTGQDLSAAKQEIGRNIPERIVYSRLPRALAAALRINHNLDIAALYPSGTSSEALVHQRLDAVAAIGINMMPTPRETTTWDEIFAFRDSARTMALRDRFTAWLRSVADTKPIAQIQEEIRDALYDYEQHLKEYDLTTSHSGFECLMAVPTEVLEALVTARWAHAVRSLFFVKRRHAELLAAERSAPGRQTAYLFELRRTLTE